ncbi:hypothetical protein [Flammeovirga sp. SubArs3]|uniref:hypothetical protein n=1 Tax=Flammeovirga sp. SubArs3 TaxID=2995316 RepID=UPI00248AAF07|nr:hypothetical protein [Flammeovirga sp. SubArs3]
MSKKDPHNPFEDILNDFVFPRMKDEMQKDKVKSTIKNVFEAVQGAVEQAQEQAASVDVEVNEVKDDPETKNIRVEIKQKKKKKAKKAEVEHEVEASSGADALQAEVKSLKAQLKDKEEIISLLKDQIKLLKGE